MHSRSTYSLVCATAWRLTVLQQCSAQWIGAGLALPPQTAPSAALPRGCAALCSAAAPAGSPLLCSPSSLHCSSPSCTHSGNVTASARCSKCMSELEPTAKLPESPSRDDIYAIAADRQTHPTASILSFITGQVSMLSSFCQDIIVAHSRLLPSTSSHRSRLHYSLSLPAYPVAHNWICMQEALTCCPNFDPLGQGQQGWRDQSSAA